MTRLPIISSDRREAIGRAAQAVERLAIDPEATEPAHRQAAIVNDPRTSDWEAWDAVAALEGMVLSRGLITAHQVEVERRAAKQARTQAGG